jgi:hypothetical protein
VRAGARLTKFQREVETYRRFRSLTEQLLQIKEAICDARPGEAGEPSKVRVRRDYYHCNKCQRE